MDVQLLTDIRQANNTTNAIAHDIIDTSLPKAHLSLTLPLIVALQRDAHQEVRYTLLNLGPVLHQLQKLLWVTLTLRDDLHPHRSRTATSNRVPTSRGRRVTGHVRGWEVSNDEDVVEDLNTNALAPWQ
jgi:hypothetical protein